MSATYLANCDERIASLQNKIDDWSGYKAMMRLMESISNNEDKKVFAEAPHLERVKNLENCVKLVKVEKLIVTALNNPNSKRDIFKAFLKKYDDLMCLSYDISGSLVETGIILEGDHIDYCKSSLDQREFIRVMCSKGYKGYLK
jgi:hypothetical protein